ncbi:hypothetical protein R0H17_21450 [Phytobacter diazotrophicus]|uniref:hypothetical protein n=1 Tax=Phytobacter diazotrophicus TaxID=395631 RepID=UPI002935AA58|nr:hypothetical protein [Phytobacter diazotrophicus]MDV2904187.1 hypothetical protein [Phytobacter diazotrophicus]
MKNMTLALSCLFILLPTFALAAQTALANEETRQEQIMAQRCLTFGLNKLRADNPGLHAKLQTARPNASTAVIERFDENIGSQHIATQVTANLETKQGATGEMMCLLENDEPLFVYFYNLDE